MSSSLTYSRYIAVLFFYLLIFAIAVTVAPFFGGETLNFNHVFNLLLRGEIDVQVEILLFQRIPRILLAVLVGGTLASVGAAFQVILRNPLAEPYTLGVTGGASVGAVLAIAVPGFSFSVGILSSVQLMSLIGAALSLFLIYSIARRPGGISMSTLLLAGVTISIISSGLVLFVRYIANPNYLVQMDRWMMGGLDVIGYRDLAVLFPLLIPGLGVLFSCMVEMNHLTLGDDLAIGHGVNVSSVQKRVFFGACLATAAVVSLSGPIGFVGLIVPHAVRRLTGYDHRIVMPGSFCLGAAFLVLCDTVARTILAPTEIPVGIITALVGGPVFIRILLQRNS